jgi:hypothetical protein
VQELRDLEYIIYNLLNEIMWLFSIFTTMYKNTVAGLVCKKNLPLQFARCPSQSFSKDLRFSLGNPVSSTMKIDRHDIPEILLKVTLNTINQNHLLNPGAYEV